MVDAIIAILGGIIAASPLIIANKPNAKELIDKITPYQGWIGVVLTIWGIWGMIQLMLNIKGIGLGWSIALGVCIIEFIVGFLLGYGLISKYVLENNENAKLKGQELQLKLAKYQVPAGVILIVLGVLSLFLL